MAETIKAKMNNCIALAGQVSLECLTADPDVGTAVVNTGFNRVLAAFATYAEDPSSAGEEAGKASVAPAIYRSVSSGVVTFYAGNMDGVLIDYLIIGI
jgi:hypothetical protein